MDSSPCKTLTIFVVFLSQIKNLPSSDPAIMKLPSLQSRGKNKHEKNPKHHYDGAKIKEQSNFENPTISRDIF